LFSFFCRSINGIPKTFCFQFDLDIGQTVSTHLFKHGASYVLSPELPCVAVFSRFLGKPFVSKYYGFSFHGSLSFFPFVQAIWGLRAR